MRISDYQISEFVERLACAETGENVTNQYAVGHEANEIRRANLLLYLTEMASRGPGMLLVGEAPGYLGCRLTGVPFTSEALLILGTSGAVMFGSWLGYRTTGERPNLSSERTASVVWRALSGRKDIPLLWNAFPFHPHRPGDEWSNRPPTVRELARGAVLVRDLAELFGITQVVAVGKTASITLRRLSLGCERVRHPSHGGARQFATDLPRILDSAH